MPETLKKMRLDKFLTQAAELTRSEAKQKIKKGSVTVDGEVVKKAEMKVSSEDAICLDGEVVTYEKYRYIMLINRQELSVLRKMHSARPFLI